MKTPQRWLPGLALAAALLLGFSLRIHDAVIWNPYWGYDGGAHLRYAEILTHDLRLPTLVESYVAWHEPFFYALTAVIFRFGNFIPLAAGLGTFVLAIFWTWRRTHNAWAAALTAILLAALPVALAASTFFSNEGLAQFLILLGLFLYASDKLTARQAAAAGIIFGLALLTKITAAVGLAAVLAFALWQAVAAKNLKPLRPALAALAIALALSAPWYAYKARTFGGVFANPYEAQFSRAALPANFFWRFDRNVFFSPFWPAGSNSFWSVAFASAVTDYDALLQNPDAAAAAPKNIAVGADKFTTTAHKNLSIKIIFLAAALLPLFLFAGYRLARRLWEQRKTPGTDALLGIFAVGSLAALALNITRFGSIERGNLKMIFIFAAAVLAAMFTAESATDPALAPRFRRALTAYAFLFGAAFAAVGFLLCWI